MFDFERDELSLITVPGWAGSGARHWQSVWEKSYPLACRAEQQNWLYPERATWQAALADTIAMQPGKVVIAAHSLGCHTAIDYVLSLSLAAQGRIHGMLLVAPPQLPIKETALLASGELAPDMPIPAFTGFDAACHQRLPVKALCVASRNDPFCPYAEAERMAASWGVRLVDAGDAGHMGSTAGLGSWQAGQRLLQKLMLG